MEVLPYFKAEYDAGHAPTLLALDQAASSCEKAAQRLRTSTTVPFSQLDFEAEHPGWSFSSHVTSSGRSSSPSPSSALKAQPGLRPGVVSTHSTRGSQKKRGRPRKTVSPEHVQVERKVDDKKRTTGESGRRPGNPGQSFTQSRSNSQSRPRNRVNHLIIPVRSSTESYDAYGLSDPPSPEPEAFPQVQSRTDGVEVAIAKSHHDVHPSRPPAPGFEEESLRSLYQRSVTRVIESLTRDYEEHYPGLDGPALCEEVSQARNRCAFRCGPATDLLQVYISTMRTLPSDLLQGNQSKRRKKTLRRFAKEVWGQKILEHTSKLRNLGTSTSEHSKSDIDCSGSFSLSKTLPFHDLSTLGPGEGARTSSEPTTNHRAPCEISPAQLESVGLSPEPETRSGVKDEYGNAAQSNMCPSGESVRTQDLMLTIRESEENRDCRNGLGSPSTQLSTHPEQLRHQHKKRQDTHVHDKQYGTVAERSEPWALEPGVSANHVAAYASSRLTQSSLAHLFPYRELGTSPEKFIVGGINTVNVKKESCENRIIAEPSELAQNAIFTSPGEPTITNIDPFEKFVGADNGIQLQKLNKKAMGKPKYLRHDHRYQRLTSRKGLRRESNAIITITNEEVDSPLSKTTSSYESKTQVTYPESSALLQVRGQDHSKSDPSLERALGALSSSSKLERKPYKPGIGLKAKNEVALGSIKHVDFTTTECEELLSIIRRIRGFGGDIGQSSRDQLKSEALSLSANDIEEVIHQASVESEHLVLRKRKAIRKFLQRLKEDDNLEVEVPSFVRLEYSKTTSDRTPTISTLLRQRTYGLHRGASETQRQLRSVFIDNLTPQRSWKGASGDIVSVAWNPNSQTYAVGATATSNPEDLQYNRPNNLLYGNVNRNTLHELPDHRIDRPKPNTIAAGPNSSEAVYEACDPKVYKTVPAIQFSLQGSQLFTASHDSTVKIWDIQNDGLPCCFETLCHEARVDNLEVSPRLPKTFATGTHTTGQSIRVYTEATLQAPYKYVSYGSSRAQTKPQRGIYPECLRWGTTSMTEHLLLAGFARWGDLPNNDPGQDGELCIWDVSTGQKVKKVPSSQSVFVAAFHPFLDAFATGGAPGNAALTHKYSTRTVVRIWDMRNPSPHWKMELECPALDMQDLIFHPRDANIVAAGCTDGATYVWDNRKPDYVLHKLQHGEPVTDWDNRYGGLSREQGDAGVTMTLWGSRRGHLFTGATDGIVKCWDINHAPEDALVRDVAQLPAGVSCGSFSPDSISLLVGDSTGGIHLLSSDPGFPCPNQSEDQDSIPKTFEYVPAPRKYVPPPEDAPGEGQLAALESLRSGQLVIDRDFGVGQGPAYIGPYATYAHNGPPSSTSLLREIEEAQPMKDGRIRDNAAARTIRATIARRREELNRGRDTTDPLYCGIPAVHGTDHAHQTIYPSKKRKHSDSSSGCSITASYKKNKTKASICVDLTSDGEEDVDYDEDMIKIERDKKTPATPKDDIAEFVDALEDDHWFPYMDLDLFAKLNLGA